MENKKFKVCVVFFIVYIILINNSALFVHQNNSKMNFSNFGKNNESLTSKSKYLRNNNFIHAYYITLIYKNTYL